jgi:hypothetical protein
MIRFDSAVRGCLQLGHPETSSSPVTRGCFGTSRAYWPQGFSLSAILNERFFQAAHLETLDGECLQSRLIQPGLSAQAAGTVLHRSLA